MARDSKLWEEAYQATPRNTKKHKVASKPILRSERKEPMILLAELEQVIDELRVLNAKRRSIKKQLHSLGHAGRLPKAYREQNILLYALRLEGGHFYIGMTRNVEKRYRKHLRGSGSMWTKLMKPIEIVETRQTLTNDDSAAGLMEDAMTIEYARKYGTQYVHGGGYCQRKPSWPAIAFEPIVEIEA